MKKIIPLVLVVSASLLLMGCSQQVQTGEIISCKQCQREISSTVVLISVPTWKASNYHISRSTAYCQSCGNESVPYVVTLRCLKCRRVHAETTETAMRKSEPRNCARTEGFCSVRCENQARTDEKIDRISERAGDVIGRGLNNFLGGLKRH